MSEPGGPADLILFDETGLRVDFAAGEFDPTESESARRKVHIWVQKFWERLFASFAKEAARKSAR